MKRRVLVIFGVGLCVVMACAAGIIYLQGTKTPTSEAVVASLRSAIQRGDKDALIRMLSDKVEVCEPGVMAINSPPIAKAKVIEGLQKPPNIKTSIGNYSYYFGMLFDSDFVMREF